MHSGPGGTQKTVHDLIKNLSNYYECYLLVSDTKTMTLSYYDKFNFETISIWSLYSNWLVEDCYNEEYSNIYFNILIKYQFDIVHIHHLIFHTFDLPLLCNKLKIPLFLSIHDLYFICPAYNLLDGDYNYCDGDCNNSKCKNNCFIPMANMTNIKNMKNFVQKWRTLVSEMFLNVTLLIAPSKYIKNIILKYFETKEILIIEHGIDHKNCINNLIEKPSSKKPTKILFLGNLYLQKGCQIIKKLYEIDINKKLEFHFLGFTPSELSDIGIHHGIYDINDLEKHINSIKPSFIGIFSICGESYCYTLSESWSFGIPVFVSKLGALEERVGENGGGWFIEIENINKTHEKILSIINDENEYLSKLNDIKNISLKSTKDMSEEYLALYDKFIN